MPTRETLTISELLRASAAWVALVVVGVLLVTAAWSRTPLGYTPAPIRFVACGSLATVVGDQMKRPSSFERRSMFVANDMAPDVRGGRPWSQRTSGSICTKRFFKCAP